MAFIAPIVSAIGAAAAGAASFISGLGIIGRIVIGVGLSLAAKAFQKKPKSNTTSGTRLEVQYGADRAREIGLGLFAVAGHDVYSNTFGKANKYISKVFVLSDFRIDGLSRLAVNGKWVALGGTEGERGFPVQGDYDGHLWVRIHKGLPDQAADAYLVATSNPGGRWTAAHRLAGVAYAVVTAEWDDEDMNSFPSFLFELRGAPLYDVRRDSTAGGSGSHRWDDQSTWEYGNGIGTNPILQAYCYERGFTVNGELIIGKAMPAGDLPAASWMAAANVCDEGVNGAARYRCGCIVTAANGVAHRDNLQVILESAGAMLIEKVDGDQPIVGANQAIVATLTDDDLIVGEAHRWQGKRSRTELINTVFGSYNNPEDLWTATAYQPAASANALAADRERHAVQLDWEGVYDENQAVRLADIAIRQNRYQATAVITVRPRHIGLEVGDWIGWNSARRGNRVYQIVGRQLTPHGPKNARCPVLTLQEVGNGIYDGTVSIPEYTPRTQPAGPVYTLTVEDFVILPTSVKNEKGRTYPALEARWTAIDDLTVVEVVVQYWKKEEPEVRLEKRVAMPQAYVILVEGILPTTQYQARARVICNPPRDSIWSRTWSATTVSEDLAFELELDREEIREIIANGAERQAVFDALLQALGKNLALITSQAIADNGEISARIFEESLTRADETGALARRSTLVEAKAQGVATGLQTLEATVSRQDAIITAQASAMTGVQASIGNLSASGLISMQVVAQSGSGATAFSRIAILAKASNGEAFKETGFYIETTPTSSVVFIRADKFIVSDGSSAAYPLTFEDGVLKLKAARFEQLVSTNGLLRIDGTTGRILMSDNT